ncbi:MAG TPA: DNA-processing protein DprA [Armatimonadota bacterium]|jgi:DNA processing protein
MPERFTDSWQEETGLWVRGMIPTPLVAIVGTRHPSPEAVEAAFSIARALAECGVGVVSGLALGIDAAAHQGCLAGGGSTVAVLGHGLDAPLYPAQHAALASEIVRQGALVSPFPPEAILNKKQLLLRNRWIALLARAVWVVQTGVPGGALAAAAHARRFGVPVLATSWEAPRWRVGFDSLLQHGAEAVDPVSAFERLRELAGREPLNIFSSSPA